MAAIGKFVLWGKENLCLIRPLGDSLALETLYYAEDIRSREEIDEAVGETEVKDAGARDGAPARREPRRASSIPRSSQNEYRGELRAMLEAKLAGEEIVAARAAEAGAGRRPHGGAQAERRPGAEGQAGAAKPKAQEGRARRSARPLASAR